jgi:hypothetical protein
MDGVTGVIVDEFFDIVAPAAVEPQVKLTLEQYYAMPKPERSLLRRLAFGMVPPACFSSIYDLAHIKAILEATGEFPERWVDQDEADELAQFLAK